MKKIVIAVVAAGALSVGCGEKGSGDAAPAGGGAKIGVQACDDYIAKMEACFAKDPATKAASEAGFKTTRETWAAAAARGGAEKDALKTACEAMVANMPPNCK